MRAAITVFVLTVISTASAQMPMDVESGKYVYHEVVQASKLSKDQVFERAQSWIKTAFTEEGDTIYPVHAERKSLKANANIEFSNKMWELVDSANTSRLTFNIAIYFKEGRYKYKIDNFMYSYYLVARTKRSYMVSPLEEVKLIAKKKEKLLTLIDQNINTLIDNMKSSIKTPQADAQEDEHED